MTEVIDPFWGNDISVLYRTDRLLEFFISSDQSTSEQLNAITRLGIYLSVALAMYHKNFKYLSIIILFGIITSIVYYNVSIEKLQSVGGSGNLLKEEVYTYPTINNPFGNSSIIDIIDNPNRPPMVAYDSYSDKTIGIKEKIEDKFNYNLYNDLGDLYGKQNSQRQFYTTPSRGSIPADPHGDFKNFLYGGMKSCKENTYECGKSIHEDPRYIRKE